jgi:hypothetical protein
MTQEEQIYIDTRDAVIKEAQTHPIYFETAAPACGYWVFPCGCCRHTWLNEYEDPIELTCDKHRDSLDAAICKQTAYEMAVDLYHRAGMGPRFSGPGQHLAEFDEIIRIAERYMERAERIVRRRRDEESSRESSLHDGV